MAELSGPVTEDRGDTLLEVRAHFKFFFIFQNDDSANGDSFGCAQEKQKPRRNVLDGADFVRDVRNVYLNVSIRFPLLPSVGSNTLLISNNTNTGTINAFNAITGQFVGTLKDINNEVIHIDQLWGIDFGGGAAADGATNQLFFTAGPDNNLAGLFGVITVITPK